MNKSESIYTYLKNIIKKYFFINTNDYINHENKQLFMMNEKPDKYKDSKLTIDYLEDYRFITRWQTI